MRRVSAVFVLALVLAGCGGRAAHLLPASGLGADGRLRGGQSSNLTTFNATLWYGDDRSLYGIPLTNGPSAVRIDGSYAGLVDKSSRAMTIAIDGTLYELIQNNDPAAPAAWQLRIYAPGTQGAATPEETLSGSGYPQQVMLVADGIDVLWSTRAPGQGGTSTLSTFAYGTASNAPPIRTLALGTNVTDVATDRGNNIYAAKNGGAGITVYPAGAQCACSPMRTIATGLQFERSIAVANDGTVYVLTDDPRTEIANVNAYAPGNNGPSASRVLGPFYESIDVAPQSWAVSSPTGGITVDAAGDLFVGFADNAGQVRVEMYRPNDSGTPAPARTIPTPSFSTYITSITIGPALPGPPLQPTLYVGSRDHVFAFDPNASGTAAPWRAVGHFYFASSRPGGPPDVSQLSAIATGSDGTLATVSNTRTNHYPNTSSCGLAFFDPSADGSRGLLSSPYCPGYSAVGIARGPGGELDILMTSYGSNTQVVQRVVNQVPTSVFHLNATAAARLGIAVDRSSGTIYLTTFDHVEVYALTGADGTPPTRSIGVTGATGAMCVAPDGTLYVAGEIPGLTQQDYIYAFAPGASAPTRTLGPYPNKTSALACDSQGRLYVGVYMWDGSGTKVKVFAPNANGVPPPLSILYNPIPATERGGAYIVSLALTP
jgi:hypothetical protein